MLPSAGAAESIGERSHETISPDKCNVKSRTATDSKRLIRTGAGGLLVSPILDLLRGHEAQELQRGIALVHEAVPLVWRDEDRAARP